MKKLSVGISLLISVSSFAEVRSLTGFCGELNKATFNKQDKSIVATLRKPIAAMIGYQLPSAEGKMNIVDIAKARKEIVSLKYNCLENYAIDSLNISAAVELAKVDANLKSATCLGTATRDGMQYPVVRIEQSITEAKNQITKDWEDNNI